MHGSPFNPSFAQKPFLTKVIFIQEAFKNIQGLFKGIPQLFNFQGLFKAHALWKQFLQANEMKMYT